MIRPDNMDKILSFKPTASMLNIGVVTKNVVDSVIEFSDEKNIPLMLIASRRQIDSSSHGGGYVNNWDTESFSDYVKGKDTKKLVYLCRDHGGPWQNTAIEKDFTYEEAFASACKSFEADIASGFQMLHLDPSVDMNNDASIDQTLQRLFELYDFCINKSQEYKNVYR